MNKTISYIYVILSAVCWGFIGFSNRLLTEAGMTLGNRVFVRNFGTLLVLTVVFALFHRQVFRIRLKHLPIFLGSGLISILLLSVVYFQCQTMCSLSVATVLPYIFYTKGLEGVESGRASIITNIEPVVETLVGITVFHEALTVWTVLGVGCVIGCVALLAREGRHEREAAAE